MVIIVTSNKAETSLFSKCSGLEDTGQFKDNVIDGEIR